MSTLTQRKQRTEAIEKAAEKLPEKAAPYVKMAAPYIAIAKELLDKLVPILVQIYVVLMQVWERLQPYHPQELVPVVVGLAMAFLGGEFPALIAAMEAYRQIGWEPTLEAAKVLYADGQECIKAISENDSKETNKLSETEQLQKSVLLVLRTSDPEKCGSAIEAILAGLMAVLAVLKVRFARVVALGISIGDALRVPALRYGGPPLKAVVPEEYQKWIVPGLKYLCKTLAVGVAYLMQRILSAIHSSIRGGQMAAKASVHYLKRHDYVKTDCEAAYIEVASLAIAVLGFSWQIAIGFRLPFPLNLVLLPASIADWILMWFIRE